MQLIHKSRRILLSVLAVVFACSSTVSLAAQSEQGARVAPGVTAPAPPSRVGPRKNQEHLAQWMDRHRFLPLQQQQSELQNERGFSQLPAQTRQRMMDRLTQLNNMPEEQRRRILERTEVLEHLTPPQRQQVRSAMADLGSLPPDRRRLVARAFRDLRDMPPQQRQTTLSSDRIRSQLSGKERSTLNNLLNVEPYLPPQRSQNSNDPGR